MPSKSARFEMRLEPELMERLDTWCTYQQPSVTRAEGVRLLLDKALPSGPFAPIDLSDGEKLILAALTGEVDAQRVIGPIMDGQSWILRRRFPGLFSGENVPAHIVDETFDILDMWMLIEGDFSELSAENKKRLKEELGADEATFRFPGFDANREYEHFSVAKVSVAEPRHFDSLKDHELNSHFPTLDAHRRMLNIYKLERRKMLEAGPCSSGRLPFRALKSIFAAYCS